MERNAADESCPSHPASTILVQAAALGQHQGVHKQIPAIFRLPDEILSLIFTSCLPKRLQSDEYAPHPQRAPLLLCQVCRQSNMAVDLDSLHCQEALAIYLSRSKKAPFWARFIKQYRKPQSTIDVKSIVDVLTSSSSRVSGLHLEETFSVVQGSLVNQVLGAMPQSSMTSLTHLWLILDGVDIKSLAGLSNAPLTHVSIVLQSTKSLFSDFPLQWDDLVRLKMEIVEELVHSLVTCILTNTTRLEALRIQVLEISADSNSPLPTSHNMPRPRTVFLRRLSVLDITCRGVPPADILRAIDCPVLTMLRLICVQLDNVPTRLDNFDKDALVYLATRPLLQTFDFHNVPISSDILVQCLIKAHHITKLRLSGFDPRIRRSPTNADGVEWSWNDLLEDLIWETKDPSYNILPDLAYFHIATGDEDISGDVLVEVLQSRHHKSHPACLQQVFVDVELPISDLALACLNNLIQDGLLFIWGSDEFFDWDNAVC